VAAVSGTVIAEVPEPGRLSGGDKRVVTNRVMCRRSRSCAAGLWREGRQLHLGAPAASPGDRPGWPGAAGL